MGISGDELVKMMGNLSQRPLVCRKCGTPFTLDEGFRDARLNGIPDNVILCKKCHTVYTWTIELGNVILQDDVTNQYSGKIKPAPMKEYRIPEKIVSPTGSQIADPSGTDLQTRRKKRWVTLLLGCGGLLVLAVIVAVACWVSGLMHKPICPPDGAWTTDTPLGLTSFEISSCNVTKPVYIFLAGGQLAVSISSAECAIEKDGQFTCQEENGGSLTITGKFMSDQQAEGTLAITKGFEFGSGEFVDDLMSEWKAAPKGSTAGSTKTAGPRDVEGSGGMAASPSPTNTLNPSPIITLLPSPTITIMPSPTTQAQMVSDKDGMTIIYIPGGEFLMGSTDSDPDAQSDEKPQHTVTLDPYLIYQTEVTNAMYARFVAQTGYRTAAEKTGFGWAVNPSRLNFEETQGADWRHPNGPASSLEGLDGHPVVQINWHDAQAYCAWAGGRLPTEAEWEKAARGIDGWIYPWGNEKPDCSLSNNDCAGGTTEVGSYPSGASPYGLLDMIGNVWEWVQDWYGDAYYAASPSKNPVRTSYGEYRILRGSSWYNPPSWVSRSAARYAVVPDYRTGDSGFRCVMD